MKRTPFKANCSVCGAEIERHAFNGHPFKCYDCKKKRRADTTREWYKKPGNKDRKTAWTQWNKETKRFEP